MINKTDENYVYILISHNLKRLRKAKHLTQTEFAYACNYSEGFIMNIESKKYHQTVSIGTLWKFAEVLEVDIREFFTPIEEEA